MKTEFKVVKNDDSTNAANKTFSADNSLTTDMAQANAVAYAKTVELARGETVQVVHNVDDFYQGVIFDAKG
jgi:hypothetical protein